MIVTLTLLLLCCVAAIALICVRRRSAANFLNLGTLSQQWLQSHAAEDS